MSYFLHRECGGPIYLDLTEMVRILSTFGIGKTVLRAREASIITVSEVVPTTFYCAQCSKTGIKSLKEIGARCLNCGKEFCIEELYSPSKSGGIYCETCSKLSMFSGEDLRKLTSLVKKMSIK